MNSESFIIKILLGLLVGFLIKVVISEYHHLKRGYGFAFGKSIQKVVYVHPRKSHVYPRWWLFKAIVFKVIMIILLTILVFRV